MRKTNALRVLSANPLNQAQASLQRYPGRRSKHNQDREVLILSWRWLSRSPNKFRDSYSENIFSRERRVWSERVRDAISPASSVTRTSEGYPPNHQDFLRHAALKQTSPTASSGEINNHSRRTLNSRRPINSDAPGYMNEAATISKIMTMIMPRILCFLRAKY